MVDKNLLKRYYIDIHDVLIIDYRQQFVPNYDKGTYDENVSESLLKIWDLTDLKELDKFSNFIVDNHYLMQAAIDMYKDEDTLFSQPIIMVALYLIVNCQQTLIQSWPFTYDSLLRVVKSMNYSTDILK